MEVEMTDTSSNTEQECDAQAQAAPKEPQPHCAVPWVMVFWGCLCLGGLVLGIIYFIVKVNKSDCSSGTALPGDVTAPDGLTFGETLAVIWGFVPYACALGAVVELFRRRTMWPLLLLILGGVIVVLNEGLFKRVISQDRPDGSCLHSKGMPSSHATLACAYFTWFHLEALFKPHLTTTSLWTVHRKLLVLAAVWVLLLPVPFTRVALQDHSWAQIGVGSLIGACVAVGWCSLLSCWGYKHLDTVADLLARCPCCWGPGLFRDFTNDFFPPPDPEHCSSAQRARRTGLPPELQPEKSSEPARALDKESSETPRRLLEPAEGPEQL